MAAIGQAGSNAVTSVASHPVPAILIGAGLTWLLLENAAPTSSAWFRRARGTLRDVGESFSETLTQAAGSTRKTLGGTASSVGGSIGSAAASVMQGFSTVGEYARTGTKVAGRTASRGAQVTRDTLTDLWRDHPLILGATVLAAGFTAGMLLPPSSSEQRVVGGAAKEMTRRVRRGGKQTLQKARQIASNTAAAAAREARRQGLAPGEIGRKVKRVVSRASDVVTSAGAS